MSDDPYQLCFSQGDTISVISMNEDGWWQGELNGRIGSFPGSYVKLEVKSKKQQFQEDFSNIKAKLAQEQQSIEMLQQSKEILLKEMDQVKMETEAYEQEVQRLKDLLKQVLKENKMELFATKFDKYPCTNQLCLLCEV